MKRFVGVGRQTGPGSMDGQAALAFFATRTTLRAANARSFRVQRTVNMV